MRKTIVVFLAAIGISLTASSQYWQQTVDYSIDVTLHDNDHSLDGFEKILYTNHSPDTLRFIWFHLWPNAYKNDKTAFSDQLLGNGNTKFYFSKPEERGYINRLNFRVNNITAQTEDHPQHIDIIKLLLPAPLPPGASAEISTPFHVQLPHNVSRGGHEGQSYQVTQWFPKPAVYDRTGWHPMTYLDQGEFYSEFGTFDVRITVPENYVVAATGVLQDAKEKEWLKSRSVAYDKEVKDALQRARSPYPQKRTTGPPVPASAVTTKTLHYVQDRIHDFAWFADKRFIVDHDTIIAHPNRIIDVYTYYTPEEVLQWKNSVKYCKEAVRHYSALVGEYPYDIVQAVQGPASFGGGMEYPTITAISPMPNAAELDATLAHEIGHNWFYGILASNERDHPWMDEGVNTYYEQLYSRAKYGIPGQGDRTTLRMNAFEKLDQPINDSSVHYSASNYSAVVYQKTADWMSYLASVIGKDTFDRAMQTYYHTWQFRHPQPEDLRKVFETVAGRSLADVFALQDQRGLLPNETLTGTKSIFLFQGNALKDFDKHPAKNLILWGPAIGFNSYDKFRAGLFVSNFNPAPTKLQFLFAPLYGTGSKKAGGQALINYSAFPGGKIRKIDIGLSAAAFSMDRYSNDAQKAILGVVKWVPGIRFTANEKDPRSTRTRFFEYRHFGFREDGLNFYRDTTINGTDTTITSKFRTGSSNRSLNQIRLVIADHRALYPYDGELKVEQGKDFIRAAFTGNYFFNYADGGGLGLRVFAGKFFYTTSKTSTAAYNTSRYQLNMTGPNGYEDYTYSDYFTGRNQFEGMSSQQIMLRDGAFKVRTDLLAEKVGRSDDWIMAANFTSSIPRSVNPLSVLPFPVPLKVFVDIGTYAQAWQQKATTDRFLYDAGIYLPILKETINIYVPLIYSKVFSDYIKSTLPEKNRLLKKISFCIDISHFNLRKFTNNPGF